MRRSRKAQTVLERDVMKLEEEVRYLRRELSIACARIQVLERRAKDVEGHLVDMTGYAPLPSGCVTKGEP